MNNQTETFDLSISKTTIEVVKLTLPHYRKTNCHFFKIFSQDKCIQITIGEKDNKGPIDNGIHITNASLPFNILTTECTEQEFLEGYNQVKQSLNEVI